MANVLGPGFKKPLHSNFNVWLFRQVRRDIFYFVRESFHYWTIQDYLAIRKNNYCIINCSKSPSWGCSALVVEVTTCTQRRCLVMRQINISESSAWTPNADLRRSCFHNQSGYWTRCWQTPITSASPDAGKFTAYIFDPLVFDCLKYRKCQNCIFLVRWMVCGIVCSMEITSV